MATRGLKDSLRTFVSALLPEEDPKVTIFDGRDAAHDGAAYLAWTRSHRDNGYVVNCPRRPGTTGIKLHRASCHHITYGSGPGFVEGDYIKACSTARRSLEDWAKARTKAGAASGCYCIQLVDPLSHQLLSWLAKHLS